MTIEQALKQEKPFPDEYRRLAVNVLYTREYLAARFNQRLKPYDATAEQFNVLRILRGRHPEAMAVKDIQERMIGRMSNTSRLVEKLRRKGLVERCACLHDRRAVEVSITPQGLERLTELEQAIEPVYRQCRTLSEEEAEQLNHLLDKLRG